LHLAAVPRDKNFSAALAFLLLSDKPDHLINAERVSVFIEPPNGDAFFASFHNL
jgi:hypothetical protein